MDLMITGIVRSSHGLDGYVSVESTSGEVDHFAGFSEVILRSGIKRFGNAAASGEEASPPDAGKRYEIEAAEGNPQCFLIKFRGVDTPEQAKKLAGLEILVPRDKACPLAEGEYYVSDLCQCVLVYKGTPLGTITGVMEGGAGDLLEVSLTDGSVPDPSTAQAGRTSGKQTRLVPLRKEFVGKIDMKARTVELMHRWILE